MATRGRPARRIEAIERARAKREPRRAPDYVLVWPTANGDGTVTEAATASDITLRWEDDETND